MGNVEHDADTPPRCPVCGTPAIHWGRHDAHGVATANYLCGNAHGWLTKWVTI